MRKIKGFDVRQCVSTDETKYFMTGVYHEDGFQVATDGRMLVKIERSYPHEYEKTIRDKDNHIIEGQFPNYKRVIPDIADMVEVPCPDLENARLASDVKGLYGVKVDRFIFSPKAWKAIYDFAIHYPVVKVYEHKKKPEEKAVMFVAGDNLFVTMPCNGARYYVGEAPENKPEPVKYRCDGDNQAKYLKVTYKQLKDIGLPVLTVGKAFLLSGLDPMCLTWGKNGWDVKVYDMANLLITAGDGANGIHIPAEIVKKYQDGLQNGDDYRAVIDRFLDEVDTWYKARNVA